MSNVQLRRPLSAVPAVLLVILAACGDRNGTQPINPKTPAALAVTGGGNQSGLPGTALASPIVARVTNARGNPVAGANIVFKVTRGAGAISDGSQFTTVTDANGTAQVNWALGSSAVRQQLSISAGTISQQVTATVDTARLLYLSTPDTVSVGDTIRVWASAGLADTPGEVWGSMIGSIGWSSASYVTWVQRVTPADRGMEFFYHSAPTSDALTMAGSLPSNAATSATAGPRMFRLDFVALPAAKGHDIVFNFSSTGLVAARTFTNLRTGIRVVGATVTVR